MSRLARRLRRLRGEDGAIALLTLAFMVAAGMATILLLWGIGRATGAYNSLYAANQSAAYAAATATRVRPRGAVDVGAQIRFLCATTSDPTDCVGGETFDAADAVMRAALGPGAPGAFGLRYPTDPGAAGTNVWFVDERGRRTGQGLIQAYEIGISAGQARAFHEAGTDAGGGRCLPAAGEDEGYYDPTPSPGPIGDEVLQCWRVSEFGVAYPLQFHSGVISRVEAELPLYPGCQGAAWCPEIELRATSAATQAQPAPVSDYGDYYSYD